MRKGIQILSGSSFCGRGGCGFAKLKCRVVALLQVIWQRSIDGEIHGLFKGTKSALTLEDIIQSPALKEFQIRWANSNFIFSLRPEPMAHNVNHTKTAIVSRKHFIVFEVHMLVTPVKFDVGYKAP